MQRKGFPESYDRRALLQFVLDVKSGVPEVVAPVYSHLTYDIVPDEMVVIQHPDILIVEGLNVLQPAQLRPDGTTGLAVSDFFDFSVYVDASVRNLRHWYLERFMLLRATAFRDPAPTSPVSQPWTPTMRWPTPVRSGTRSTART